MKILQRSMAGVSSKSQIKLSGNTFFLDQGYGGTEGEVKQWSIAAGATLLGTAKRMRSFPFTYDQVPGPDQQLITEKGAAAQYWAKKSVKVGATNTQQYAMANRNGLGRVVLMQTTNEKFGPGKFTLVTRGAFPDAAPARTSNEQLLFFEEESVDQLTSTQRSPEWFNQRQFRITGTSALVLWKHIAHWARCVMAPNLELEPHFATICNLFSLKYSKDQAVAEDDVADRVFVRLELTEMSVADLKDICRMKKLPVSGNKATLIDLIVQMGDSSLDPQQPVL